MRFDPRFYLTDESLPPPANMQAGVDRYDVPYTPMGNGVSRIPTLGGGPSVDIMRGGGDWTYPIGDPNVGGNISQYDFSDPIDISSGPLPNAPLSGPIPFYSNQPNTGGFDIQNFGGSFDITGGDKLPEAPLSGPIPTTDQKPNVGGTDIANFGGPFDISGGYTPSTELNYYDAGGGRTYVYDSNWNYLYTAGSSPTTEGQQPTPDQGSRNVSATPDNPDITGVQFPASQPSIQTGGGPTGPGGLNDPSFYPGGTSGGPGFNLLPGGQIQSPGGITELGSLGNRMGQYWMQHPIPENLWGQYRSWAKPLTDFSALMGNKVDMSYADYLKNFQPAPVMGGGVGDNSRGPNSRVLATR
jgi:hypothetical protein